MFFGSRDEGSCQRAGTRKLRPLKKQDPTISKKIIRLCQPFITMTKYVMAKEHTRSSNDASPCERVRSSCLRWIQDNGHQTHSPVTIDRAAIPQIASEILKAQSTKGGSSVVWDEEGWHYRAPTDWPREIRQERMALYILALDAINFCFWPEEGYEYEDLAVTLSIIAALDHDEQEKDLSRVSSSFALSASNLATLTANEMIKLFVSHHKRSQTPPDMDQRCSLWNDIGQGLVSTFQGSAWNLISQASNAPTLVQLLVEHFAGFRDYDAERDVWFLKRAQICVGDWNASLQLNLAQMDQLTTFADYRVPQLLREYQILVYHESLAGAVDRLQELEAGSEEEVAIRSATVVAVEWLVEELHRQQQEAPSTAPWTAVQTDWYLWQVGEQLKHDIRPHHRVRTIFY